MPNAECRHILPLADLALAIVLVGAGVDAADMFVGEEVGAAHGIGSGDRSRDLDEHGGDRLYVFRRSAAGNEAMVLHDDNLGPLVVLFAVLLDPQLDAF